MIFSDMLRTRLLLPATLAVFCLSLPVGRAAAQQRATAPPRRDAPAATVARGVIDGVVTDTNLVPLISAEVTILRTTVKISTNNLGRFRFTDVPSGQYLLIVKRLGYRPASAVIDVPAGDTVRLSYTLERSAQGLAAVNITEKRESVRKLEFDQRRREGVGEFFTEEQLDKRAALSVADILRYARTMTITPDNSHNGELIALSKREGGGLNAAGASYCPMQVVVDNVQMPSGFPMDLLPPPKMLMGIEVYAGAATAPMQFGGNDRRCGMILVWTKDGR